MLKKINRLSKSTDFSYLYKNGLKAKSQYGLMSGILVDLQSKELTLQNMKLKEEKRIKIGFVVNKKIGKAFFRNKVKRQLRAIAQEYLKSEDKIKKINEINKNQEVLISYILYPNNEYEYLDLRKTFFEQLDFILNTLLRKKNS